MLKTPNGPRIGKIEKETTVWRISVMTVMWIQIKMPILCDNNLTMTDQKSQMTCRLMNKHHQERIRNISFISMITDSRISKTLIIGPRVLTILTITQETLSTDRKKSRPSWILRKYFVA